MTMPLPELKLQMRPLVEEELAADADSRALQQS